MTNSNPEMPKTPRDIFDMLAKALEQDRERQETVKRVVSNLEGQLIALCNEFLAADRKQHSIADTIIALADTLATTMAQHRPDAPSELLRDLDRIFKHIRATAVENLMGLHCKTHHSDEKHKEPGA